MGLIEDALARQDARPAPRRIDYDRMNKVLPRQRAALTRANNAYKAAVAADRYGDDETGAVKAARENLARTIKSHIVVWDEIGAWPDQWATWQIALNDSLHWSQSIDLRDL